MHPDHSRRAFLRTLWFAVITCSLLCAAITSLPVSQHWLYLPLVMLEFPRQFEGPLISEVLYDPVADEPAGEWIELYNPADESFDLSQFKVGDAELPGDHEGMLRFPNGAAIAPQQIIVVANRAEQFIAANGFAPDYEMIESRPDVPDLAKYVSWSTYSVELTDNGDEVLLLNAEDKVVDAVSWGSSTFAFDPPVPRVPEGYSLERKPADNDRDSAQDWKMQRRPSPGQVDLSWPTLTPTETATATPTSSSTPTETPAPCGQAPLLLTEILYDPLGDSDPEGEWVEIYNPSDSSVNLACVKIGDEETPGQGEGMLIFPRAATLEPRGIIVVANQAASFLVAYGYNPDYEMVDSDLVVPDMQKYVDWASGTVNLSNVGDEVLILDGDDQVVDMASWAASAIAFDPAISKVIEGHSLERKPADVDTDTALDWRDQPDPSPGEVDLQQPTPTHTATPTSTGTATPTPTRTPLPCGSTKVLISEVLYDPISGTDPSGEWFEVYNPSNRAVNLACLRVGDEETRGGGEGMLSFPSGALIDSGAAVVVANRSSIFESVYGYKPDWEIVDTDDSVPDMLRYAVWGTGSVNFSNSGDEVLLLDSGDHLMDAVSWGTSKFAFDPSLATVIEGHSLERRPANQDADSAADWIDQANPDPGHVRLSPSTSAPSPTPSPTRTRTPTASRTSSPSPSPTPSYTHTKTSTPVITASPTRTSTVTNTCVPGATPTSVPSFTPSPSQTPTLVPTITPSRTPTLISSPAHTDTFTPTLTPPPVETNTPTPTPNNSPILISEVHYYPADDDPEDEWIEIYNPGTVSLDLSEHKIGDEEISGGSEGMLQ
ncbi:MAG TPA: lamin tail domain-containing protein, partial [Anaerolineales bacterium]|nr:lamin tail domain-containing protein [Anaerolineales bacterium]